MGASYVIHYLEDFITVSPPSPTTSSVCQTTIDTMLCFTHDIGFAVNSSICIWLDTQKMELGIEELLADIRGVKTQFLSQAGQKSKTRVIKVNCHLYFAWSALGGASKVDI